MPRYRVIMRIIANMLDKVQAQVNPTVSKTLPPQAQKTTFPTLLYDRYLLRFLAAAGLIFIPGNIQF
jgi:hypothetical protein